MNPTAWLAALVATLTGTLDAGADWTELERPVDEREADPRPGDVCEPGEAEACAIERAASERLGQILYPVRDVEEQARLAKYADGRFKRTAYPPVDLRKRIVVIGLHQTGVERPESSKRWHLTTCHRAIGPTGVRYRVHPVNRRLVAINRLDRAPYHAVSIEVGGNFEGEDGSGKWWMPTKMGSGRASEAQLSAVVQECDAIVGEVAELGGRVVAIVPHKISGRDKHGKPNRPLCPGSRVWSEAGEQFAATRRILTPAEGFAIGGAPIPASWRGPHHDRTLATWRG